LWICLWNCIYCSTLTYVHTISISQMTPLPTATIFIILFCIININLFQRKLYIYQSFVMTLRKKIIQKNIFCIQKTISFQNHMLITYGINW
jgi:hypothetical protein